MIIRISIGGLFIDDTSSSYYRFLLDDIAILNSNLKTLLIQVQLLLLPQLDLQVNLQTGVTVCMVSRGTQGLYPIHTTTHACAPQSTTSELSPPTEPLISL